MKITNKFGLPGPLVKVVENDAYNPGDTDISCTGMLKPPRIYQLCKRYDKEIEEDVTNNVWRLIGNNAHYLLERIGDWYKKNDPGNVLIEKRFYAKVLGWKISGQADLFEIKPGIMTDWKVTSVWSVIHGIKPEHEKQLNILAWLARENGINNIKKLQIVALLRDWSKFKVAHGTDYPKCQVAVQEAELRPWSKIKALIEERVALHQTCERISDDRLPLCTAEERWDKDTVYAVKKKGRKTAMRLLSSMELAEQWMKDNGKGEFVEVRKGERTRCEHYCDAAPFCNQYKEYKKEQEGE